MELITSADLRELADGIDNKNHAAEVMRAKISFAISNRYLFDEPDRNAKNGPCCSQLVDDVWISTGCHCRNSGDAESAEWWRDSMNRWLSYKRYLDASTNGIQK